MIRINGADELWPSVLSKKNPPSDFQGSLVWSTDSLAILTQVPRFFPDPLSQELLQFTKSVQAQSSQTLRSLGSLDLTGLRKTSLCITAHIQSATHTYSHTHTHEHTHMHTHTLSLSLSHTHTLSNFQTHTHTI